MSFYNTLKKDINTVLKKDILKNDYKKEVLDMFQVSEPPKDKFGDVSTNAALVLSKFLKTSPKIFADFLIKELKKISTLPFDCYQIYDLKNDEIKLIKKKYKINIIVAITVKDKKDVLMHNNYKDVADIFLFDSKGYEKSMSFDHKLIKDLRSNTKIMLAGNIQIDDDLENYNKITDIIDISGGLETSGLKDISKINIFLNKIKQIKNET